MDSIEDLLQRGAEHFRSGRLAEATEAFRRAAALRPDAAEIHLHLGNCFAAQNQPAEAAAALEAALAINPDLVAARYRLGLTLQHAGHFREAESCFRELVRRRPQEYLGHHALGVALQWQGRLDEAKDCYRRVIALRPAEVAAHFNLASVLQTERRMEDAQAAYETCVGLEGGRADLHFELAKCLHVQAKYDQACAHYRRAISLEPSHHLSHFLYGSILLARGDFEAGWREFEWRLRDSPRTFAEPNWDGSPLAGRRILLHVEYGNGLGDTLQFIRYVPLVAEHGGQAIIEVQPALIPLLTQSGFQGLIAAGTPLPAFDVQAPLMSLPSLLGTRPDTVPAPVPYLSADPSLVEVWRAKLARDRGFRVGIAWHASPTGSLEYKSFPLAAVAPLARVEGVKLISLQKGQAVEQLSTAAGNFEVVDLGNELDEARGAFTDTAAVMRNLDLVVACDTSVAHLAGALNVPVWIALLRAPEWRWMCDRDDSPWYPSARLFRQSRLDDWSDVMARMASELAKLVGARA